MQCSERDSNPYARFWAGDFKSPMSTVPSSEQRGDLRSPESLGESNPLHQQLTSKNVKKKIPASSTVELRLSKN